jgi:hypothetical protein
MSELVDLTDGTTIAEGYSTGPCTLNSVKAGKDYALIRTPFIIADCIGRNRRHAVGMLF